MAVISSKCLTFLDPEDQYRWCDGRFDQRVFIRFIEHSPCLEHVCHHTNVLEQDVHLFFSSMQQQLLETPPSELEKVKQYIFCQDRVTKNELQQKYGRRPAREIILKEDLEFEIAHLQVKLLYSLMKQMPDESNERDQCGKTMSNTLIELGHIIKQNMSTLDGEPPLEIDRMTEKFDPMID